MKPLEVFVSKALKPGNEPFDVQTDYNGATFTFMSKYVGNAKYIYGDSVFDDEGYYSTKHCFNLYAIVINDVIYWVRYGECIFMEDVDLFPNVKSLKTEEHNFEETIQKDIVKEYWHSLIVPDDIKLPSAFNARREARMVKMFGKKLKDVVSYNIETEPLFSEEEFIAWLCGVLDIKEDIFYSLDYYKVRLQVDKKEYLEVEKRLEDEDLLSDWEIRLCQSLTNLDARYVNVDFELNGKEAVAKVSPDDILNVLEDPDNWFSRFAFISESEGKECLKSLGASDIAWNHGPKLRCKNIESIKSNRKTIYERKVG